MNIFERSSRAAVRFPSVRGELMTEQLWGLPLQSKSGFDLDTIAKAVNTELKNSAEESFVSATEAPGATLLQLKLDLIKHVIASRQADLAEAANRAARKAEKERLMEILAGKQDDELKGMSKEDLQARIAALG